MLMSLVESGEIVEASSLDVPIDRKTAVRTRRNQSLFPKSKRRSDFVSLIIIYVHVILRCDIAERNRRWTTGKKRTQQGEKKNWTFSTSLLVP